MSENLRPPSPSAIQKNGRDYAPDELNPELAAAKMANQMVNKLGTPSIISKAFAVRYGIFQALNNSEKNQTGYDSSIRLELYEKIASSSVNIDGKYFERVWAYLMKPKYIISGTPFGQSAFEDDKPSLLSRIGGLITGKNPEERDPNAGNR